MNSFEFLIRLLDTHEHYLKLQFKEQQTFNRQTWYQAKLKFVESFRQQIISHRKEFEKGEFLDT